MTATAWLAAVTRRGGTCRLDKHRRVWVVPRAALTPALRDAFSDLKVALAAALVGCGTVSPGPAPGPLTIPCPGCGRRLPAARLRDADFTVCVCCKLARIARACARPVPSRPQTAGPSGGATEEEAET